MTYLIQGNHGSLKYWVKLTLGDEYKVFEWAGLQDNATHFSKEEAENAIKRVRVRTRIPVEIVPAPKENNLQVVE